MAAEAPGGVGMTGLLDTNVALYLLGGRLAVAEGGAFQTPFLPCPPRAACYTLPDMSITVIVENDTIRLPSHAHVHFLSADTFCRQRVPPWDHTTNRRILPDNRPETPIAPAFKQVAVLFLALLVIFIIIPVWWRVRLGLRLGARRGCHPFDCRVNSCCTSTPCPQFLGFRST